jgi:leucyl aminopeptidase (aminopeptidase T)
MDITFDVRNRKGLADTGKLMTPGAFGNLPAGEAMVAPVENYGTGKVVVDGVIAHVGVLEKPIILKLVDGQIVRIEGDEEKLSDFMSQFEENINKVAEIGIGTNRLAKICGNPLVDEKVYSTIHLGFGNNLFMGGNQGCNMHFDMIITKPNMYIDGTCIISEGKHIY